jgi:hypothetical protein
MNDRLRSLLPWLLLAMLLLGGNGGKASGELDVLIIEDIQARASLPIEQLAILTSESDASVISWLKTNARTWRIADDETDFSADDEAIQRLAIDKPKSLPWLSAARGNRKISEPLPKDTAKTLQRLKGM